MSALIAQCSRQDTPFPIVGNWQAYSLSVEDSVWQVETSPVILHFDGKGDYLLEWYGGYEEFGKWQMDFPALIIRPDGKKKETIRIIQIQMDTLVLKGQLQNKSTVMGFYRLPDDTKN